MSKQEVVPAAGCCTPLVSEPVAERDAAALAQGFKALGDPIRIRLLSVIGAHEGGRVTGAGVCVCELNTGFEVTAPTISHHLKVLRQAGLIDCERRGTWVYYWIVPAALARLASVLALPRPLATMPG